MCPVLSVTHRPDEEPTVTVAINDREYTFLIDTGATRSCIRERGLPLSNSSMDTQGFSGAVMRVPFTKPVEMEIGGRYVDGCLLVSPNAPANLLGRDLMAKLNMTIHFEEDGSMICSIPGISGTRIMTMVTHLLGCDQIRARPTDLLAFTRAVYTIIADIPELTGKLVELPKNFLFRRQSPHSEALDKDLILEIEALEVSPTYGTLMANDHTGAMWACVIFHDPNMQVGDISDDQLFVDNSRRAVIVFQDSVLLRTTLETRPAVPRNVSSPIKDNDLAQVPPNLWTKGPHDVGLVHTAVPFRITLKEGAILPRVRQYPLSKEAEEGIAPVIQALVEQGVIYPGVSPCNTPIYPVKKAKGNSWRMIQDLRPLNDIVVPEFPVVPDPSVILTNIPQDAEYFSVIDLKNAFFSIPLHPDSHYLTAFSYHGSQYLHSRLPQGYCESPSVFNSTVKNDLSNFQCDSTVLQ